MIRTEYQIDVVSATYQNKNTAPANTYLNGPSTPPTECLSALNPEKNPWCVSNSKDDISTPEFLRQ